LNTGAGAGAGPSAVSGGAVLLQAPEMRVTQLANRIYVIDVFKHLTRALIATALKAVWGSPGWRQPWGLVVVMHPTATYDGDIRTHELPPDDKRSVGTCLVSGNQFHRIVIKSIGIAYGAVSRFHLTAHATLEEGIATQLGHVKKAEANKRRY
jgi:hypothetical protein